MEYKVSSEICSESNNLTHLKPIVLEDNVVSIFKFIGPISSKLDSDGDFDVQRNIKSKGNIYCEIELEHSISTNLNLVGLQIWRGAFLLADWVIYNNKKFPEDCKILELGSGIGLTSIITSMFKSVICTDINEGKILELLENNVVRNKSFVKFPVSVLELNFFSDNFHEEIIKEMPNVKIILAADVIYDNDITYKFVNTMRKLLSISPECAVYIALEKRYVFVIADCDTCAPCYEYFLECLQQYEDIKAEEICIDFPQYFVYDRVKELVMWKVTLRNSL